MTSASAQPLSSATSEFGGHVVTDESEPHVSTRHPELHHYTGLAGLTAIWKSQALWATRYDFLNDRTEMQHLGERLHDAIMPVITDFCEETARRRIEVRKAIDAAGGLSKAAAEETRRYIETLHAVTFKGIGTSEAAAQPYVISFCAHTDEPYEAQNGLLSQWRGYGGVDGYAIVFDSAGLEKSLDDAYARHAYVFLGFGDVVYNDERINFQARFPRLVREVAAAHRRIMTEDNPIFPDLHNAYIWASARFKHRGFFEEREVRIIAAPTSESKLAEYAADPQFKEGKPLPTFFTSSSGGLQVPRISMFGETSRRLPIKRIIVGPGGDQKQRAARIRTLVEGAIEISISETPFTGSSPAMETPLAE